jgi:hypothetical protein
MMQDAEAVFQNNEEVRIIPIYRDPVHDFGFFQYNPAVSISKPRIYERPECRQRINNFLTTAYPHDRT